MADDFQEKLNALLSNPDVMKTISALAGGSSPMQPSVDDMNDYTTIPDNTATDLSAMVNNLSNNSDDRINLLYALKPYMRSSRADHMDMAIKILKLTKLTSLL